MTHKRREASFMLHAVFISPHQTM